MTILPAPQTESSPTYTAGSSLLRPILLGFLTSLLLDFCFPVAGPMRPWRGLLAWVALVPLLWALLSERAAAHRHYFRRAFLTAWLSGLLWYILNCYWVYQTMYLYGHVPPLGSVGILILYSAILGLYFGVFGLLLAFFRRRFSLPWALLLAPFLWTALELAAARITSVPWDQLGYSQINNLALTSLAPVTGVYGISFLVALFNSIFAVVFLPSDATRRWRFHLASWVLIVLMAYFFLRPPSRPPAPTSTYAVLLQPNIQVAADANWSGNEWHGNLSWITAQATEACTPAYSGMPPADALITPPPTPDCSRNTPPPGVVLWPETASWFQSDEPRTIAALATVATTAHAPFIAGMFGHDSSGFYNSAVFTQPNGAIAGRYDKIHLVPFGEYIPYRNLFFFAHQLTHQLVDLERGTQRRVFTADNGSGPQTGAPDEPARQGGHTFGIFICYESVFADEIRHFTLNGAQVLVNLSDDGWYGDTSAPWQHLDMTRMRAIENRRWLLLDTNSGITTVIDPWGRVTLSAPRHQLTSLVAPYGYRSDLTFYTRYGDLFAYLCSLIVLAALTTAAIKRPSISRV